jgi:hypothetical protein
MEGLRLMQLPHSKTRVAYIEQVKTIEADIKDATSSELNKSLLKQIQKQLGTLAEKYQYSEEIGTAKYKLYELQALVHYFNGDDDDALDFINQAVITRGHNYERAEKLRAKLVAKTVHPTETINSTNMTKQERRKRLIGLDGWLAWYVVGLFIGTSITIFNFFNGGVGMPSSNVDSLNQYRSGLGDTLHTLTTFENIAIIIYVVLLVSATVLILRRKRLAKAIAIAGMVFGAVYTMADYAVASSLLDSANLTQYVQSELGSAAGCAGRDLAVALIWIPYFLVSKRVRATLTK